MRQCCRRTDCGGWDWEKRCMQPALFGRHVGTRFGIEVFRMIFRVQRGVAKQKSEPFTPAAHLFIESRGFLLLLVGEGAASPEVVIGRLLKSRTDGGAKKS